MPVENPISSHILAGLDNVRSTLIFTTTKIVSFSKIWSQMAPNIIRTMPRFYRAVQIWIATDPGLPGAIRIAVRPQTVPPFYTPEPVATDKEQC